MRLGALVRTSGYLGVAEALSVSVRAASAVLVARSLGPRSYGALTFALTWTLAFYPLASGGVELLLGTRGESWRAVVGPSRRIAMLSAVTFASVAFLLGNGAVDDPSIRAPLAAYAVALVGRSLAAHGDAVLIVGGRQRAVSLGRLGVGLIELGATAAVLLSGYGVLAVAAVHALAMWIHAIAWVVLLARTEPRAHHEERTRPLVSSSLAFGFVEALLAWFSNGPILLARYVVIGEATFGQTVLALQISALLAIVPRAVARAINPALAAADERTWSRMFADSAMLVSAFGAAVMVGAVTVGPGVLVGAFGRAYEMSGTLLLPMAWLLVLAGWLQLLVRAHAGGGRRRLLVSALLLAAAVLTATTLLSSKLAALAPFVGSAAGAAVAMLLLVAGLPAGRRRTSIFALLWAMSIPASALGAALLVRPYGSWLAMAVGLVVLGGASALCLRRRRRVTA